jgi:hypothetical protein
MSVLWQGLTPLTVPLAAGVTYLQKALAIAPANLIAYWPQSEASGTALLDSSGAARDGAYVGVTLGQNGIGDGLACPLYDGADYARFLSASFQSALNTAEGTFSIWGKVLSASVWTDGLDRNLLSLRASSGTNWLLLYKSSVNNQSLMYWAGNGVAKTRAIIASPVTWFHIAITWSQAANKIITYFNGAAQGADNTYAAWSNTTLAAGLCLLGASTNAPAKCWDGYLAHAAVWNTPLTSTQVLALATVQ